MYRLSILEYIRIKHPFVLNGYEKELTIQCIQKFYSFRKITLGQ